VGEEFAKSVPRLAGSTTSRDPVQVPEDDVGSLRVPGCRRTKTIRFRGARSTAVQPEHLQCNS
jgi:hypothetical protein